MPIKYNQDLETVHVGGDVKVGPYTVGVAGAGGRVVAAERSVAVAGLTAQKGDGTRSYVQSGEYGASITAFDGEAEARTGIYGVAVAGKSSVACGGSGAVATIHENGTAATGDGGIAAIRGSEGSARVGNGGVAFCLHAGAADAKIQGNALIQSGTVSAGALGLASVRSTGKAVAGPGGVAIAWNDPRPMELPPDGSPMEVPAHFEADARIGVASAGKGGIIVAFMTDQQTGARRAVVGFVGTPNDTSPRAHYDLKPGRTIVWIR
jgi:hypothetical protein